LLVKAKSVRVCFWLTAQAFGSKWEGEAPAEPKLFRKTRLGRSLALPVDLQAIRRVK